MHALLYCVAMKKIIAKICILIAGAIAFGAGAAQNDDTKSVAARIAASQQIDKYLPMILQKSSADGIEGVKRGAMASIESNTALSDGQRMRAKEIVDQLAPQMATDLDALHRRIDVNALIPEMIETVYPKYFTQAEMLSLAEFFESTAFHKAAKNAVSFSKQNLETLLTPQEKKVLMNFYSSPLGQKQRNPQIAQESLTYLKGRIAPMLDVLVTPYRDQLMKELQSIK